MYTCHNHNWSIRNHTVCKQAADIRILFSVARLGVIYGIYSLSICIYAHWSVLKHNSAKVLLDLRAVHTLRHGPRCCGVVLYVGLVLASRCSCTSVSMLGEHAEGGLRHMKARIMVTDKCNKHCSYCCNKQYPIESLGYLLTGDIRFYSEFMLTGGEPMLEPLVLSKLIQLTRHEAPAAKIYLYTAEYNRVELANISRLVDGITITIHDNDDAYRLKKMHMVLGRQRYDAEKFRINVMGSEKAADLVCKYTHFPTVAKTVVNECPLPNGEYLLRLPAGWDAWRML